MEDGVNDRNDNKNEKNDEEQEVDETTDFDSTTIGEVKGVTDERFGKDVDLDKFDASTCSDDIFMIFLIKRKKPLLKIQLFG